MPTTRQMIAKGSEIAHNLHECASETFFWDGAVAGAAEATASEVSNYATKNKLEFVAGVFTGIMYGKIYSADLMTAYQACGGPSNASFP